MKKFKKQLLLILAIAFILAPYKIYAEPEESNPPLPTEIPNHTPSPSPTDEPIVTPSPSPSPTEDPITPLEKTIILDKEEVVLESGKTITLTTTVTPNDEEIEWTSSDEKIVTVENGKLTAGNQAGKAIVTAAIKGTNIKATCNVEVRRALGTDATLKKLVISNGKLDKNFDSNIFDYSVTINANITKLTFDKELSDKNATFFGPDNNSNLKNGDKLTFKVIAEDEKTNKTYTLTIIKDAASLELKSLKINGYALNESFQSSLFKYTASIPYEVDTITVEANAKDNAAIVKVDGFSNLKVGENQVTITVADKNGNNKKYTVMVTREEKASIPEKPTSIITSSNAPTSSNNSSTIINGNNNNDDDFLKYLIVSIACLILFIIGGIGIYFYLRTSPRKLKKEIKIYKEKKEVSPMIEVEKTNSQNMSIMDDTMDDIENNTDATKEYKIEEKIPTLDELLNDDKDV